MDCVGVRGPNSPRGGSGGANTVMGGAGGGVYSIFGSAVWRR